MILSTSFNIHKHLQWAGSFNCGGGGKMLDSPFHPVSMKLQLFSCSVFSLSVVHTSATTELLQYCCSFYWNHASKTCIIRYISKKDVLRVRIGAMFVMLSVNKTSRLEERPKDVRCCVWQCSSTYRFCMLRRRNVSTSSNGRLAIFPMAPSEARVRLVRGVITYYVVPQCMWSCFNVDGICGRY